MHAEPFWELEWSLEDGFEDLARRGGDEWSRSDDN